MIKKYKILSQLQACGLVAVIRGSSAENAYQTALACIKGQVTGIEIAFTTPHADHVIERLAKDVTDTRLIIGAGTVLDEVSARIAILAGANFIVSPNFDPKVAQICNLYGIPYFPGCYTPQDIQQALAAGVDVIKIFPASLGGPHLLAELKGPFPNLNLMPSGGVTLENLAAWFEAGAFIVGIGNQLVGPGQSKNYRQVTTNALNFYHQFHSI